jgi:hypothetical protein
MAPRAIKKTEDTYIPSRGFRVFRVSLLVATVEKVASDETRRDVNNKNCWCVHFVTTVYSNNQKMSANSILEAVIFTIPNLSVSGSPARSSALQKMIYPASQNVHIVRCSVQPFNEGS